MRVIFQISHVQILQSDWLSLMLCNLGETWQKRHSKTSSSLIAAESGQIRCNHVRTLPWEIHLLPSARMS